MSDEGQRNGGRLSLAEEEEVFTSAARDPLAVAVREDDPAAHRVSAVSSGPFEIAPSSFSSPPPSRTSGPPAAVIENAMERGRPQLPVSAIVGIGAAVLAFVVGLGLLLFR